MPTSPNKPLISEIERRRSLSWSGATVEEEIKPSPSYYFTPTIKALFMKPTRSLNDITMSHSLAYDDSDEESFNPLDDLSRMQEEEKVKRKGLFYGIRKGSILAGSFNLCGNTLGAGALSLAAAFSYSGWVNGLILLFISAFMCLYTIALLVDARDYTGIQSLEEIMVVCFGRRWGLFLEVNILILCFGSLVAYLVVLGDLATPLLLLTPLSQYIKRDVVMLVMWICIIAPLCLLREMSSLRFTSGLGVCSIFFLAGVTTYSSIQYMNEQGFENSWGNAQAFSSNILDIFRAIPIIMFAFCCQMNVINIYNSIDRPSVGRMMKVAKTSISATVFVYFCMALFGYLQFPLLVAPNILSNYCLDENRNPVYAASYFSIIFTLSFAFPLVVFPLRHTAACLIYRYGLLVEKNGKDLLRPFLGVVLSGLSLIIALNVPNITMIFSLLGGTSASFVCFITPTMISLKLGRSSSSFYQCITFAVGLGSLCLGLFSTCYSIYQDFFVNQGDSPLYC